MYNIIFLSALALVWIIFAVVQDLKKREVPDWLSFSLIIFALGFRFFYSLFSEAGFGFFYQGVIGLGIFLILGNLLYYGHMFAGGDAKLMIALGPILPFSEKFLGNLKLFVLFFVLLLFVGAVYSLTASIFLSIKNFKKFSKEFGKQMKKNKIALSAVMFLGLALMALGFSERFFFSLGILIFCLPYFYVYLKAVDESCMVKHVKVKELSEGDWLYRDLKIGRKLIKAEWGGLSKEEIKLIRKKYKSVIIKQGIPFTPAFLMAFLIFIYFLKTGLWNSFW